MSKAYTPTFLRRKELTPYAKHTNPSIRTTHPFPLTHSLAGLLRLYTSGKFFPVQRKKTIYRLMALRWGPKLRSLSPTCDGEIPSNFDLILAILVIKNSPMYFYVFLCICKAQLNIFIETARYKFQLIIIITSLCLQ